MFTHLVLSGGGLAGFCYMGALSYLQSRNCQPKHISGTSIGAFFGFLFSLDVSMVEIKSYMMEWSTQEAMCSFGDLESALLEIVDSCGLDIRSRFETPMRHFLKQTSGQDDITFMELTKLRGISLTVCATSITNGVKTYFSVDTSPNVSVIEAVLASMAVPMLAKPVTIGDQVYVDGGLCDNFPIDPFIGTTPHPLTDHILGLIIEHRPPTNPAPTENLFSYMMAIAQTFSYTNMSDHYSKYFKHIVKFDKTPVVGFPFDIQGGEIRVTINEEDIEASYQYGYDTLKAAMGHEFNE